MLNKILAYEARNEIQSFFSEMQYRGLDTRYMVTGYYMLYGNERRYAGNLIGCEAKYTFHESDCLRKRWSRLLFEGSRQFHFVVQGALTDEYKYWEPILFQAMETVHIN